MKSFDQLKENIRGPLKPDHFAVQKTPKVKKTRSFKTDLETIQDKFAEEFRAKVHSKNLVVCEIEPDDYSDGFNIMFRDTRDNLVVGRKFVSGQKFCQMVAFVFGIKYALTGQYQLKDHKHFKFTFGFAK